MTAEGFTSTSAVVLAVCGDGGLGFLTQVPCFLTKPFLHFSSVVVVEDSLPPGEVPTDWMSGGGGWGVPAPWHSSEALQGTGVGTKGKPPSFAGVIDADAAAVLVVVDEGVAGEEEGVGAVGGGGEEAGVEGAGAGGDEVDAAGGGFAGDGRFSDASPWGSHS